MATIIDSFLTTFGLDPKPFAEGAAEVREQTKKTREEISTSDKRLQEGSKRSKEAVTGLRNELTGLFLAFAGGSTLKSFFKDLISGDAAVGRLANNLGVNAKELDAWGRMAEQAGGSAGDAASAFTNMVTAYQSYRLDGKSPFDDDLRGLGVELPDFKEPATALLKMAEAGERMDRAEFFTRLTRIGIPASVITTLSQGRAETEKLVAAMTAQSKLSEQSVADAQAFEAALSDLSTRIKDKVRPALTETISGFVAFLDQTDVAQATIPALTGILGALAVATIGATWPWLVLAGVIGGAVAAVNKLLEVSPETRNFLDKIEAPLRAILPDWAFARPSDGPEQGPARMTFKAGGAGPALTPGGAGPEIESMARQLAPGVRVTSRQRTPERNAAVGGKPNSRHLTNDARDFAPAKGQSMDDLYKSLSALKAAGYIVLNERDHIHVQSGPGMARGKSAAQYAAAAARPGTAAAAKGFGNTVTIGQLTVNTQATDAKTIAAELPGAIRRRAVVFNANTGLD